jgi:tetratricopeptide (TPR) repeat protein
MKKSQIIAVVIGLVAVVVLYNLPKVIINKTDKEKLGSSKTEMPQKALFETKKASENDLEKIASLRKRYNNSQDVKKSLNFADSLAKAFVSLSMFDSAASYADKIVLSNRGNLMCLKAAGNICFNIYSNIADPSKSVSYAEKAREYYRAFLKNDSTDMLVRNNFAMTYVVSNTPMQAIMELRKILVVEPQNVEAQFNLGLLAMQSGQYDKAVNRFKTLVEADGKNWNAKYYLALSLIETGKKQDAKNLLNEIAQSASDLQLAEDAKNTLSTID